MTNSLSAERLALAKDLVDDLELSRLQPEQLLLKALRLARLVEDAGMAEWLSLELNGYNDSPASLQAAQSVGRIIDGPLQVAYFVPLAAITGQIASLQVQMSTLQVPSLHFAPSSANPNELVTGFGGMIASKMTEPATKVLERLNAITQQVTSLSGIRSRILARIHGFAVRVYHKLAFSAVAESIFEGHKGRIDSLLATAAPDVLDKIPSIYSRLAEGEAESISQALNSVRRLIKVFADSVYPPADTPVVRDGTSYEIGSDRVLNRIKLFLLDGCESRSRCERLNRTLRDTHERASAGAHSEVSPQEARALFLQAYLTLGEILDAVRRSADARVA